MQELDEKFQKLITALQEAASAVAGSLHGTGSRAWAQPENKPTKFDWAEIHAAFTRDAINKDYEKASKDGVGPLVAALLTQGDVLAGAERDYRVRHMTRMRMLAHAAARREGHSDVTGVPQLIIQRAPEEMLKHLTDA